MNRETPDHKIVIGIIDAYDALHYRMFGAYDPDIPCHDDLFSHQTHKRWRFYSSDWNLMYDKFFSRLNEEDVHRIYELMSKILDSPPAF